LFRVVAGDGIGRGRSDGPAHAAGHADAVLREDSAERMTEVEARLGDPAIEQHWIAAGREASLHRHRRAALDLEGMGTDLAAAVGADGGDLRAEAEESGRLRLELDLRGHPGAVTGADVDGDGIVVERERSDGSGIRLVARLLLPARAPLL